MKNVYELNFGLLEPAGGPAGPSGCRCLVLETQDGAVLIDTGFGVAELQCPEKFFGADVDSKWKIRRDPCLSALSQINALGSRKRDIRHIVCTHLDLDHAGGLVDFPDAAVHLAAREYDELMSENPRYLPHQFAHGPRWVVYGGRTSISLADFLGWNLRLGSRDELALIPLFGHTAGHCGVALQTSTGTLLHCGDSYYRRSELAPGHPADSDFPVRTANDNSLRLQTLNLLFRTTESNSALFLVSTHDQGETLPEGLGIQKSAVSH